MAGIDPASFPIDPAGMTLPPDALLGLGAPDAFSINSPDAPYPVTTNIAHPENDVGGFRENVGFREKHPVNLSEKEEIRGHGNCGNHSTMN